MQILINISFSFMLMFWPIMLMMSPMMLDAPGSENDIGNIALMMIILCYPIGLFILLWLFGGRYLGMGGLKLAAISVFVIAIAFSVFGYFGKLINLQKGIANTGYSVVGGKVYFGGAFIEAADGGSFKMIDKEVHHYSASDYALDKHYLYCNGKRVEGASNDKLRKIFISQDTYLLNSTQVIYGCNILPGAQPDNFGGFDGYAGWTHSLNGDHYMVFSYGLPLPAVDKATFTPLSDEVAKDKEHIFERQSHILAEADTATFALMENSDFAKDKNHIYYIATKLPFAVKDADPGSFEILERGYAKDKNSVYRVHQYQSVEKLKQADVASFEATQYDAATKSEARDANHYYFAGKVVGER